MIYKTIPNKHIKTLNRRLAYLESLTVKGEANSYDQSEISALKEAIECMEFLKEKTERSQ